MNKKTSFLFLVAIFLIAAPIFVFADINDPREAFREIARVKNVDIVVPTVVNVKIGSSEIQNGIIAVYDETDKKFIPSYYKTDAKKVDYRINNDDTRVELVWLNDNNYSTYDEFPLSQDSGANKISLRIWSNIDMSPNSLTMSLDNYVSLPNSVSIYSVQAYDGERKTLLANYKPISDVIKFPEQDGSEFVVELEYSQPLRITELDLNNTNILDSDFSDLRFLAQPKHEYTIYLNGDRYVNLNLGESPDLIDDEGLKFIYADLVEENKLYSESDVDGDKIVDRLDNCVRVANSEQEDINENGRGDVCDDFDKDGVVNSSDNCVNEPNSDQSDIDNDDLGDKCDGEESRFTEKYPELVWGGITFAVLVIIILYSVSIRKMLKEKNDENIQHANEK